jgi:hypothetical protein
LGISIRPVMVGPPAEPRTTRPDPPPLPESPGRAVGAGSSVGATVSGGVVTNVDGGEGFRETGWTGRAAPHAPPTSKAIPSTALQTAARRNPMTGELRH